MVTALKYKIERREVKHSRIKVSEDLSVRVIAPISFSQREIELILKQKEKWIESKLAYFSSRKSPIKLQRNHILYLGERYRYFYYSELKNEVIVNQKHKTIRSGKNLLNKEIQNKWLKSEARKLILERLEYYSTKYHFNYNRVFIRSQKSKWGNCSLKKNLSFNWRLIKTPLYVIDYLVVHELVHTQIMNHSSKFWMKIKLVYHEFDKSIKWLSSNS
ncbi:MAG TPA: SprT family zinc-dependent metalloprotease [Ignavibacteriaceae bacterium]|nr:SprT family zinc-dependent metalloprotease [Ignavibacteriaceae bacterium]